MKSTLILLLMIGIMFGVAFFLSGSTTLITGATTQSNIMCNEDFDCYDGNACTVETCINPDSETSKCKISPQNTCKHNDGCCPVNCDNSNDNDC